MIIKNTGFTVKIKTHGLAAKLAHVPVKHEDVTEKKWCQHHKWGVHYKNLKYIVSIIYKVSPKSEWLDHEIYEIDADHICIRSFPKLLRPWQGLAKVQLRCQGLAEKCCIDG